MKRASAAFLVAALVGAVTTTVAAPASAAPLDCLRQKIIGPDIDSVQVVGLNVQIDPNAVPHDVDEVQLFAGRIVGRILCIEGGVATGPAACLTAKVNEIAASLDPTNGNLRYVTRDPVTGVINVNGQLLVDDLTACV